MATYFERNQLGRSECSNIFLDPAVPASLIRVAGAAQLHNNHCDRLCRKMNFDPARKNWENVDFLGGVSI